MRQLFKLPQTLVSIAVFTLSLFFGLGLPMIIPSTPYNGVIIIIVGIAVSVPLFVWAYMSYRRQKFAQGEQEAKGNSLPGILTQMHDRMMYFKTVQTKQKLNKRQFEEATPLLLDKLGLVRLGEWEDFKKKWSKKLRRLIPKSPKRREGAGWRYKVLGKATEITDELVGSKEWQIEDVVKIGEWLDGLQIGLAKLRDKDKEYQELVKDLRPYMNDEVLRELIDKHISLSYGYCSALLDINYSKRLPKSSFAQTAHSVLVESGISPHKIEIALNEILEKITARIDQLQTNQSD